MFYGDAWGSLPGQQAILETFQSAFCWGPHEMLLVTGNGVIYSGALDPTNTPTTQLRVGLVLGQITSTQQWTNYSATATDGSQIAAGVLPISLSTLTLAGTTQTLFYGIVVGGPLIAANLIGLDPQARQQMRSHFIFDDDFPGAYTSVWRSMVSKTTSYSIVAADNGTQFNNTGSVGSITLTLPPIAAGYNFGVLVTAGQNVLVTSTEGTNIVGPNNASASTIAIQTPGDLIGGSLRFYTNPAGTKWYMDRLSGNALTVT